MCWVQSGTVVFKAILHSHRDEVTRIQRTCDPQKESRLHHSCLRWLFCSTSCVVSWPRWRTTVESSLLWWSGGIMLGGDSYPRVCHVVPGQFHTARCQQMPGDSAELSRKQWEQHRLSLCCPGCQSGWVFPGSCWLWENAVESLCEHVQVSVEGLYSLLVGFWCLLLILWMGHFSCVFSKAAREGMPMSSQASPPLSCSTCLSSSPLAVCSYVCFLLLPPIELCDPFQL